MKKSQKSKVKSQKDNSKFKNFIPLKNPLAVIASPAGAKQSPAGIASSLRFAALLAMTKWGFCNARNVKFIFGFWFVILVFDFWILNLCYAQPTVSSVELIEKAKELDGQEVIYEGEVIGEVMTRGDYSWVNLNDGLNAVGIWMGNNSLGLIYFAGGYKSRGDWLRVRGVFSRACRRHGGDLDIHAEEAVKIRSGRLVKHRLVGEKKRIVLILAGVCLCLLIGQLLSRKLKTR